MEIKIAKHSGFCSGVKIAVNTAMSVEAENTYVYGEIIHNADICSLIANRGIKTVNALSDVPDGARLIIRSHGVGKDVYEECLSRKIEVVDCTCAFVKRTQKIVAEESKAGKTVVIIGEPTHPEVIGIVGWCVGECYVFSSAEDDFSVLAGKNVCVVAQTTFSKEKFYKIIKNLPKADIKTVEVFQTICYTTISRQAEAEKLSAECDAMLVIGGLNSSNTAKLYDICKGNCANVFRLKNAGDLDYNIIKNFKKLGIVMGASTPNEQAQEVLLKMEGIETEEKATTMEEVVARIDNGQTKFKKGQIVKAIISSADDAGIEVLLPTAKKEILLDKDEVDCDSYAKEDYLAKTGEEIELMVIALNPVKLSQKMIKQVAEEEAAVAELEAGKEFTVECTGFNKGGLTATYGTFEVFVPAREIRNGFVKELDKYVGKKLRLKSIEIKRDSRRKEIIASQRVILVAEKEARDAAKAAKEAEFFANIHVDDIVEGKVERATSFGAFVSVNGFDCLAHITDLSWNRSDKVTDIVEIGKTYQFKVLKVDVENKKVSIGYKQLQPQPWDLVAEKYAVGDVVHGKVVRIVAFGAFVEVEKGIDGLVHVSQISHEWLENPTSVLSIGQEVDAKVLAIDPAARRLTLSIKALEPKPEAPRREKKEDSSDSKPRKGRREPRVEGDEYREWNESSVGGASIADLLATPDKE